MRIRKIEKRLSKINNVFAAFKEDGNISKIEKDLLLGYLRDLYELILDEEGTIDIPAPSLGNQMISSPAEVKTPPPVIVDELKEKVKIPTPAPTIPIIEEPIVIDSQEEQKEEALEIISETPKEENNLPEDLLEIFTLPKATDLSDKLASSPISDVSKSMGINERYFTISELFGGDSQKFVETCETLNEFAAFDDAKSYLIDVATKYDWASDAKKNKAHNFVKHLSRKYL